MKIAICALAFDYPRIGYPMPGGVTEILDGIARLAKQRGCEDIQSATVCDRHSAMRAAEQIADGGAEYVVVVALGWPTGDAAFVLMNAVTVPMIVWVPISERDSLGALLEWTGDFHRVGVHTDVILARNRQDFQALGETIAARRALSELRQCVVGQIGYPPPGFMDATSDETMLIRRLGLGISRLDVSELVSGLEPSCGTGSDLDGLVPDAAVLDPEVGEEDRRLAVGMYRSLRTMVERHSLSALALRCTPELQYQRGYPCLAMSVLSQMGIPAACEGDLPAAVTMLLLKKLGSAFSAVFDVSHISQDSGALSLWHCGNMPFGMSCAESGPRLSRPGFPDGAKGIVVCSAVRPGRVTIAKLAPDIKTMFMARGEAKMPASVGGSVCEVMLEADVESALDTMVASGMGHHICVTHGDMARTLSRTCACAGIEVMTPDTLRID